MGETKGVMLVPPQLTSTPSTIVVGTHTLAPGAPDIIKSLKFLGSGSCRSVYALTEELVIKVPVNDPYHWAGDNLTEAIVWEAIEPEDRQHFATIHACDPEGKWLVMERCDKPAEPNGNVRDVASKYGIADIYWGNTRQRASTGQPVITDYAFMRIGDKRWDGFRVEDREGFEPARSARISGCSCSACKLATPPSPRSSFEGCGITNCTLCLQERRKA